MSTPAPARRAPRRGQRGAVIRMNVCDAVLGGVDTCAFHGAVSPPRLGQLDAL